MVFLTSTSIFWAQLIKIILKIISTLWISVRFSFQMAAATITYLVILIQFELSDKEIQNMSNSNSTMWS